MGNSNIEKTIERIKENEPILNECMQTVTAFSQQLEKFRQILPKMRKLDEYYGSGEWFGDLESYEKGEIPKDIPCGILSEDLTYDLFAETRLKAIEMLETATEILKNI